MGDGDQGREHQGELSGRIALLKAPTTAIRVQLRQGFATGGMGSAHHFAWQPNVRFGS